MLRLNLGRISVIVIRDNDKGEVRNRFKERIRVCYSEEGINRKTKNSNVKGFYKMKKNSNIFI